MSGITGRLFGLRRAVEGDDDLGTVMRKMVACQVEIVERLQRIEGQMGFWVTEDVAERLTSVERKLDMLLGNNGFENADGENERIGA